MSLIHLLAVGRSLATIRDQPSRYRMAQQNLLPRFGNGKGEEAGLENLEPEGERSAAATLEQDEVKNGPQGGANGKELAQVKSEILEQSQSSARGAAGPAGVAGVVRTVASPWRGWSLLGNPFRPKAARTGGPVQPELALDMVRPVRNDLKDAELELVPARNVVAGFIPAGAGRRFEKVGKLLSRLRAGLFKFRTRQP